MRAARVDANQPQIVSDLRMMGYTVLLLHMVGNGCPDICISKFGFTILVEIKTRTAFKRKNFSLTPQEAEFAETWQGAIMIGYDAEQIEARFLELMEELQSR